jgi:hypothetical protein
MFATPVTRESRPVAMLLGGSGHARTPAVRTPAVPALLRPQPTVPGRSGCASEYRVAGG